ncbi:gamma-glutamyl-gamma-aminobutyrate hydrolase family protein [uncultured Gulosibacter sp.]|uniref:gamma-glutamyl-gamma-aminobutyrate hydrolase family protein n=1 Tax=uncultured Gulosibacter sp. TaxID=1339167 RepID=UPI00288A8B6A|nr:gamma-glutamyl-gamma-aminobutyrate hydrolase family protein [uncultured Gulosibacter sp.]
MQPVQLLVVEATMLRPDRKFTASLEVLTRQVVATAIDMGYEPYRLPIADHSEEEIEAAYRAADAIVIMGGDDVDPALYGGNSDYPERGHHVTLADKRTVALIGQAATDSKPVFGICRGLQLLNVAHGGTLIQHLENSGGHRFPPGPREDEFVPHPVALEANSVVGNALGTRVAAIESSHHQAVAQVGEGMRVVGRADDGVIEAIEHETLPQFAVQWHPEAPNSDASELPKLLRALVALREELAPES